MAAFNASGHIVFLKMVHSIRRQVKGKLQTALRWATWKCNQAAACASFAAVVFARFLQDFPTLVGDWIAFHKLHKSLIITIRYSFYNKLIKMQLELLIIYITRLNA